MPKCSISSDLNINLNEKRNSKATLLKNLCNQFSMNIDEPSRSTRGVSKLDYLIAGSGISAVLNDQQHSCSDHEILSWEIRFKATTRPKEVFYSKQKASGRDYNAIYFR